MVVEGVRVRRTVDGPEVGRLVVGRFEGVKVDGLFVDE
jgi:hypothetical protein